MPKRVEIGLVVKDKAAKTRRVEIPRLVRHAKYGKILHRKTVCHVHDEKNESHEGDTVEIRRVSAEIAVEAMGIGADSVAKSKAVDIAAMRAAAKIDEEAGIK